MKCLDFEQYFIRHKRIVSFRLLVGFQLISIHILEIISTKYRSGFVIDFKVYKSAFGCSYKLKFILSLNLIIMKTDTVDVASF